jgi:polyhydroxybutyrate depolymerase
MRRAVLLVPALLLLASCSGSGSDAGAAPPTTATSASTSAPGASGDPADVDADASDGCGTPADVAPVEADPPGDVAQSFPSGGVDRVYRLAVPAGYDPDDAAPLVVNLHGSGSDAVQASVYGHVPQAATDRGMIVVTPEAVDHNWQLGEGEDSAFLEALVDDIEARYCIDRNRVHIMGMSLGAWKAAATACTEPDRYASAALVTVEVFPGDCDPLAVVAFHGTADTTVPYGEGADPGIEVRNSNAGLPGAVHNIEAWAENGGCEAEPEVLEIGDDVILRRYSDCDPGVDVELYTIEGGGHTWPGADLDLGRPELTTQTIAATEISLDWFEEHPKEPT